MAVAVFMATAGCQGAENDPLPSANSDATGTTVSAPPDDSLSNGESASAPSSSVGTSPPPRCADDELAAEIVVWHALSNDSETKLIELVDRYNAMGAGVTVELVRTGNYFESLARFASVSDERPDLLMVDARGLRDLYDSGSVIPPIECSGASSLADLLPVIASTYSIDGVVQSFPFNVSVPALVFDAALFRAAGLDPAQPPRTLADLTVAAQQIVESGVAPHGFVAWDGYGPWLVTHHNSRIGELSGLPDNGRKVEPVTEVDFATPQIVESFEWLRARIEDGSALWIGGNPSGTDDLLRLVDDVGGAAMTVTTSAVVGDLSRVLAAGAFDDPATGVRPELAAAPMPGPGTGSLVGGGAFFVVDNGDPSRAGAAAALASWLTDPAQHAEFAAFTGFSPIREAELGEPVLQDAWAETSPLRVAFDVLADLPADAVRAGPAWGAGYEIDRLLFETLTAVVEGSDPLESLQLATDQANTLLEFYNATIPD